eukprot:TRINITY_DN7407_c0_g1_i1.p1 TRINITY_DN7407_c0_g1~~TRINITY_DN7407_c0_g1_i1.p1  ORF type:complete len:260 (-),score=79.17 TRINITY_DN7407_c0_g1_i1:149-928(-)
MFSNFSSMPPFYGYFKSLDDSQIYLVTKLATGNLYDFFDSRNPHREELHRPSLKMSLAIDIARGLAILHGYGLVHRDIKPQNCLIYWDDGWKATVADFGSSSNIDKGAPNDRYGSTLPYMDPELVVCPETQFVPAHDVYGFGTVLWAINKLTFQFLGTSTAEIEARFRRAFEENEYVTSDLDVEGDPVGFVIAACWRQNGASPPRPTIVNVIRALEAIAQRPPFHLEARDVQKQFLEDLDELLQGNTPTPKNSKSSKKS